MQKAGPGIETAMRVAAGGPARAAEAGVGARAVGDGGVSQVAGDAAESRVDGEISDLEIRGIARCERVECEGRGRVSDARKGMERWPTRIR
jgi:hypothetical protein